MACVKDVTVGLMKIRRKSWKTAFDPADEVQTGYPSVLMFKQRLTTVFGIEGLRQHLSREFLSFWGGGPV